MVATGEVLFSSNALERGAFRSSEWGGSKREWRS
jgi:hypothetical protein